jgi:hypothetical protein
VALYTHEIEATLERVPDLRPALKHATPDELQDILDTYQVTATYNKPQRTLTLTATLTPPQTTTTNHSQPPTTTPTEYKLKETHKLN